MTEAVPVSGAVALDAVAKGDVVGELRHRLTRESLVRYAGAGGDFNPIHWSDRIATAMGLPGVIAHGMLTMGVAVRVVTDWLGGTDRIASYQTRFASPVVVPDDDEGAELVAVGTVTEATPETVTVMVDCRTSRPDGTGDKVLGAARVVVRRG